MDVLLQFLIRYQCYAVEVLDPPIVRRPIEVAPQSIRLGVLLETLQSWMWSRSLERTWHAHEVIQPQDRLLQVISSGRQIKKVPVATCGQVFSIQFFQKSSFRYSENQEKFILRRASNSF